VRWLATTRASRGWCSAAWPPIHSSGRAQALLVDFEQHFPGDLATAQAAAMAEQLRRS
jgi:hypothetical protein